MVSFQEVSFSLLTSIYLLFLSRFSFPSLDREPAVFSRHNRILPSTSRSGPSSGSSSHPLHLRGDLRGGQGRDQGGRPPRVPLGQPDLHGGGGLLRELSTPIRVFVPVFFNAMRIMTLMEWLVNEFSVTDDQLGWGDPRRWTGMGSGSRRAVMGRALALANTAFWSFNLFCFLLPVYMPRAFKMYYSKLLKEE
ncbi:hypothetical protein MLD38_008999 [Melastoma candidum]|uniref:Uncharacterized protein n=1 Tax=Melastoma candidum TaxID=119954 RepID=A0ACB9RXJ6_9MYRT|nr:hypothetical protein MLD38_008999 [Melastoma candidum]